MGQPPQPVQAIPTGSVTGYLGASAPAGWVFCDGATVSSAAPEYQNLYRVIGTTYGGTGTPDFKLPNFQRKFLMGTTANGNLSESAGSESHTHKVTKDGGRDGRGFNVDGTCGLGDAGPVSHLPPYAVVRYIIKL